MPKKPRDFVPPAAREEFKRLVDENGGPETVAHALGCSLSTVLGLRDGYRNPGMVVAHGIEQLFSMPMQKWVKSKALRTERFRRVAA